MDLSTDLTPLRILDLAVSFAALYFIGRTFSGFSQRSRSYRLPPGPSRLPIVGNLFDLPKGHEWCHWAKYKDIYGPISSITAFGQTFIILNSLETAQYLLETRSNIYSERPKLKFSGDLCGWNRATGFLQYNDECKTHRRFMHHLMGTPRAVERYGELITRQTHIFLNRVLRDPGGLFDHIDSFIGSITLRMLYGYEVSAKTLDGVDDPLVKLVREISSEFVDATVPGKWVVDTIPLLQYIPSWFPGAGFKSIGRRYKMNLYKFMDLPTSFVREGIKDGTALRSYTHDLLEANSSDLGPKLESIIKYSAASLYIAGTDTTISTTRTFFLVMMLNPSIQKKAQAEIDRVIGTSRLPTAEDRPNLPYVNALVKETLRWNPPVPLGISHSPSQDDVYQGFVIPKESIVVPNIWLFARDPENYTEPLDFRPEPDPYDIVFGFGRRECPGKLVADIELFLVFAQTLAVFDICRPVDELGKPINDKYEFTSTGLLTHPEKFRCTVVPRSKAAEELICTFESDSTQDSNHAERIMLMQRNST